MKSSDVRNTFVNYFKKNNHAHIPSSSLIPENDPTLLFANAGMNQFKNLFLGLEKKDYNKAVSVQKCVRAGGKHNDLENVGFTARHHTFFEMLGNFSFGDYFKKEAIHYAWELLTKDFGIPKEKLYVTVFQSDDEAADIWHKQEGISKDRIFRLGEKDNFWRMGDTGPCGPCTEIFYDHGPNAGKESDPYKGILSGEDRFVEIWNLVFMQFYEKSPGLMDPLPKPSVDTGSGLERVVAALQGKFNNYDTDLFSGMINKASQIAKKDYVTDKKLLDSNKELWEQTAAFRVLADHCRATSFLIADGALPSNEGRGYVLRRIMRRAIRYGRKLSEQHSLLPAMSEILITEMSGFYPELKNRKDHILTTIKEEESRFISTLDHGTEILHSELSKLKSKNLKELPAEIVFKLYDTYGFPADLTRLMANEQGIHVDESAFDKKMAESKEASRATWKGKGISQDEAHLIQISQETLNKHGETKFTGYDHLHDKATILKLTNGHKEVSSLKEGETGIAIFDLSPFYAEGGGQIGDQGPIKSTNAGAYVHSCHKNQNIHLHNIEVEYGTLKVGDTVEVEVSTCDRRDTAANHSATHLMHAALRKILGTHVTQAGSLVDVEKLRFDFTHNKAMTAEEIHQVEHLVNEQIAHSLEVSATKMKHKEAIASGAMALFGEKYGDEVRVLKMGDFSTELCGGTHVNNTSQIRLFKIVSESGVSAGVRRIEALTGDHALKYLLKNHDENQKARDLAGIKENWQQYFETKKDLPTWIEEKKSEIKNLEKEIKKAQGSKIDVEQISQSATKFSTQNGEAKFIFADIDLDDRDVLSQITDHLKNKLQKGIVVVIGKGENSHPIIVSVSKDISTQYSAGNILKEVAAVMGGKGGGRPDFAQGAAPDRGKIKEAQDKIKTLLKI